MKNLNWDWTALYTVIVIAISIVGVIAVRVAIDVIGG